jgi:hypothetical protein
MLIKVVMNIVAVLIVMRRILTKKARNIKKIVHVV